MEFDKDFRFPEEEDFFKDEKDKECFYVFWKLVDLVCHKPLPGSEYEYIFSIMGWYKLRNQDIWCSGKNIRRRGKVAAWHAFGKAIDDDLYKWLNETAYAIMEDDEFDETCIPPFDSLLLEEIGMEDEDFSFIVD